jgi:hypothetical protein
MGVEICYKICYQSNVKSKDPTVDRDYILYQSGRRQSLNRSGKQQRE